MPVKTDIKIQGRMIRLTSHGTCDSAEELIGYSRKLGLKIVKFFFNRILSDVRDVKYNVDIMNIHELVRIYEKHISVNPRSMRYALLVKKEDKDIADVWETMTYNRGMVTKVFLEQTEAENWLKE